jgi:hypothetical protein
MDNISSEFYEVSKIMQQIRNLVSAKLLSSVTSGGFITRISTREIIHTMYSWKEGNISR